MDRKTVRDEMHIDLSGPIAEVIARLEAIKAAHPDAEIRVSAYDDYGGAVPQVTAEFEREQTEQEAKIEADRKLASQISQMESAALVFASEGQPYPRQAELDQLRARANL